MFKTLLFLSTILSASSSFALDSKTDIQSEKTGTVKTLKQTYCESLLTDQVKYSANQELNHQLQSQLRSEVFVRSFTEVKGEDGQPKVDKEHIYLSTFMKSDVALREQFSRVLNRSIVGFERHGFQSADYAAKGLTEEDGVLYIIHHPDYKTSYIVLSRGGESLDGYDELALAQGDLKVGNIAGKTDDLSIVTVEVYSELETQEFSHTRFQLNWYDKSSQMQGFVHPNISLADWDQQWSERIGYANERDVHVLPSRSWSLDYMQSEPEDTP